MSMQLLVFLLLVGTTVALLVFAITTPLVGTSANSLRRTRARIRSITESMSAQSRSLLHEREERNLWPIERELAHLIPTPGLEQTLKEIEITVPAIRFLLLSVLGGALIGTLVLILFGSLSGAVVAGVMIAAAPSLWARTKRNKRLESFEDQLPDALNMMSRALRVGMPLTEALRVAGEEMPDPAGREFTLTYTEINYGMGVRDGLLNLLRRVPSMNLTTLITAVLVQRETGSNLAEIFDNISGVLRSRYKLHRRIRSLSAEGRMSAWVLAMAPFALAAVLQFTSPGYLDLMVQDEFGQRLTMTAFGLLVLGIFWVRRVIHIQV